MFLKIFQKIRVLGICLVLMALTATNAQAAQNSAAVQKSSKVQMSQVSKIWKHQCIDTMKFSRDAARAWIKLPDVSERINQQVNIIKGLGANCLSVNTPYDSEFYPYLKLWVESARKHKLLVWFRGNFSGWEGWFDYSKLANVSEHHAMIREFILERGEIFKDGDIFTPAPEPENGKIIGNVWQSNQNKEVFLNFLVESYNNCKAAVAQIRKNIICGYFSMNGDVAAKILTNEVVKKIGNVVVVDHYVQDANKLLSDLLALHKSFGAKIALGEFGAPIPDIHGAMDQKQQADFIAEVLRGLYRNREIIEGVNYWVLKGGSTTLLNEDNSLRSVASVIRSFYDPYMIHGKVSNTLEDNLSGVEVKTNDGASKALTDAKGNYSLVVPYGKYVVAAGGRGYKNSDAKINIALDQSQRHIKQDFVLEPEKLSFYYALRLFINRIKSEF